ncbi:hypothetical protein QQM79_16185 [Marinobacteraceae bacterium S3BR75-40.1]
MSIRLHLTLLFITSIAALLGGFMLGMTLHENLQPSLPAILQENISAFIVFGMLPAALGILLTRVVFQYLITASCSKCGGQLVYHPSRLEKAVMGGFNQVPVTYHCRACGYVHRTKVFPQDTRL